MSTPALVLVLLSAVCHAWWNILAKGAKGSEHRDAVAFTFLFTLSSAILYTPLATAVVLWQSLTVSPGAVGLMLTSAALHIAYFVLLMHGYRVADLSVVYPLSRGSGPVLATIGAVVLFGERPSWIAVGGTGCVVTGVLLLAFPMRTAHLQQGIGYALATGGVIAAYTLWDGRSVQTVPPILYSYGLEVLRVLLLAPIALGSAARRRTVASIWRARWKVVLSVAILSPAAYLMVLWALTMSPISYVASAREVSILVSAWFGTRFLGEPEAGRRVAGAAAIVIGIALLAVG